MGARLLGVLFAYEGDSVGGLVGYMRRGFPFSRLAVKDGMDGPGPLNEALEQLVRKRYDPSDELLEVQLSMVFVVAFAPIMPAGVVATLIAKIIQSQMELMKMLHVCKHASPQGGLCTAVA